MKRFFCFLFVLVLLPVFAFADYPDLSEYTYEELLTLHNRIRLALWNLDNWQSVTVTPGVWEIGVDIPAGHWTIKPASGLGPAMIIYASAVKDQGHDVDISAGEYIIDYVCSPSSTFYNGSYKTQTDFILEDGHFLRLDCSMVFTPYSGKPVFDFK